SKRIFELLDKDEDDTLRKKPTSKRNKTTKSNFDLDLGNDGEEKKKVSHHTESI
ncbi:hypothetical protein TNCV_3082201, partial [Trichonephila clavipes]